jgi:hypothetical protein
MLAYAEDLFIDATRDAWLLVTPVCTQGAENRFSIPDAQIIFLP